MAASMSATFSISIVSHGHRALIARLLADLARLRRADLEIILTLNLPEELPEGVATLPFDIHVIRNDAPKGFAANHNAAFAVSRGAYFVILNPDIELPDDPFDALGDLLHQYPDSICAPTVVNRAGEPEDSMRHFPTPFFLFKKLFAKLAGSRLPLDDIRSQDDVLMPDWVAGMFVVVPRRIYTELHGLSERYRMYYEDVDFCARARLAGYQVLASRHAKVIHDAQRDSHRKFGYLMLHLGSALKFFTSCAYVRIRWRRLRGYSS